MATIGPSNREGKVGETVEEGHQKTGKSTFHDQKPQDAGALFVLRFKGSWIHCAYHLTTSIVTPSLLSLPLALSMIGWSAGVVFLVVAAAVTFYCNVLLSLVLKHHEQLGNRLLRFRDMTHHVLGPFWNRYYVGPLQLFFCFAILAIYLLENPDGTMKLYQFIVFSGLFMLLLAQIPSFHSLRHLSLISLILCIAYSACATAGSIYIGHSSRAPPRDYSVVNTGKDRVFDVFTSISIIAIAYGSVIIPEIQATVAPPVKGKMFKGLCLCYAVVIMTFFSVAISGYWAFGNQSVSNILSNFIDPSDGSILVPKSFFLTINVFCIVQIFAVCVIYLQPTNELLEQLLADPKRHQYSPRNVIPRIISRSLVVVFGTLIAAMIPFFGHLIGVIGAFVILPLNFVLPAVMYNITFRLSARKTVLWVNTAIAVVFSGLTVLGCIASVRQITLDAKTYKLFANV